MNDLKFMDMFKPEFSCIKEFKHWIICIRDKQTTLGAVVIILKREIDSFSLMTTEESIEFTDVIKWYEDICKKKFGAIKFNYIAMMMRDSFVHYHAFPRYDKEIELFNITWDDKSPLTNFSSTETLDEKLLLEIKEYMMK